MNINSPESTLATLHRLLRERVLTLDGAMGTMIQRYKLTEADFRGERFADAPEGSARQQRRADPDASGRDQRDPPRISRRRRRHHRDQHLLEHGHRPVRLRARALRLRAESRRRAAGQGCRGRVDGEDAGAAALRRRLDGADEPDAVDLSRRQRSGVPRHDLRSGARGLRGTGARPDRRRRRPAAARDDLRHAQRQGGRSSPSRTSSRRRPSACR